MRSPTAFDLALIGAVTAAVVTPRMARADNDKQACSSAYEQSQKLRQQGKLQSAHVQTAACMRDACAEFIRTDCTRWLGEIESAQPSAIFVVRDASGHETSSVKVSLDGNPWLQTLDGKAKAIDPGEHKLRFEIAGSAPIDQVLQVREAEKNREVSVTFQLSKDSTVGATSVVDTAPPPPSPSASRPIGPFIVGGVGIAGLIVFGITGAMLLNDKSETSSCNDVTDKCKTADQVSAANQGRAIGPIATTGLIVGVVGVGAGVVWYLKTRPSSAASTSVGLGSWTTSDGGGLHIHGTW